MLFSTVIVAALAGFASAVDVQVVSVASSNNTLKFFPDRITAAVGSMVQFQFRGGNHSVVQSTFDNPCIPINAINASAVGIFSGYQPIQASAAMGMIPIFTVMINTTNPMWLYCSQGRHCQNGMVMVINENPAANATRTLENYKAGAASVQGPAGIPGAPGIGGSGSGTGGNGGGSSTDGSNSPVPTAAASALVVPSTLLAALAATFMLL